MNNFEEDDIFDDVIDELERSLIPPDASVNRYYAERYKRKVANRIRECYRISCHYGKGHNKRYAIWKAMKKVGWRLHQKRGWYDRTFIKKLKNARVRYAGDVVSNGNQYRKISKKPRVAWIKKYDDDDILNTLIDRL